MLFDGILVVDKEKDWTSHDVCAFIRRRFKIQKVGHAGTLDPLATGVLVILLGKATRLFDSMAACDKEYAGTLQLGIQTTTHDIQGKVIAERGWGHVTPEQLHEVVKKFRGTIEQRPPMVSALKHKGVRLYQLARQGKEIERPTRPITVHKFEIRDVRFPLVDFFAHVSKGTYLRTLANDLGEALGTYAALSGLRRLRSGEFRIEDAVTMSALKQMNAPDLAPLVRMSSVALGT